MCFPTKADIPLNLLYTKIGPQKDTEDQSTGHKTEQDTEYSVNGNESMQLIEIRDRKLVE